MTTTYEIVVGDPVSMTGEECPECRFDAVLTFPVHALTDSGVQPMGAMRVCVRCYEAAQ